MWFSQKWKILVNNQTHEWVLLFLSKSDTAKKRLQTFQQTKKLVIILLICTQSVWMFTNVSYPNISLIRTLSVPPCSDKWLLTVYLTLGVHAQRWLQQLCLCVCVSVKSHLTYRACVRHENAVTYSGGNEGQNICGDLPDMTAFKSYLETWEKKPIC